MNKEKTKRGFYLLKFKDYCGTNCSLQESSATESCIWFGVDAPEGIARMHLNQEQIKELLPHLQHFADTGAL